MAQPTILSGAYADLFTQVNSSGIASNNNTQAKVDALLAYYKGFHGELSNGSSMGASSGSPSFSDRVLSRGATLNKQNVFTTDYRNSLHVSQGDSSHLNYGETRLLEAQAPLGIATYWAGKRSQGTQTGGFTLSDSIAGTSSGGTGTLGEETYPINGTWLVWQRESVTSLLSAESSIKNILRDNDVTGFSIRVPWSLLETSAGNYDLAILTEARRIVDESNNATGKNRQLAVRFMAGRYTPSFARGRSVVYDGSDTNGLYNGVTIPVPFMADGSLNTTFDTRWKAIVNRLNTWCRANRVRILHGAWYGLAWSEIYYGDFIKSLNGHSYARVYEAHESLLEHILSINGTTGTSNIQLRTELATTGHMPTAAGGGQDQTLRTDLRSYISTHARRSNFYLQTNNVDNNLSGLPLGGGASKNPQYGAQMVGTSAAYDWPTIYQILIGGPTHSNEYAWFLEVYPESWTNATGTQLTNFRNQITANKNPYADAAGSSGGSTPATSTITIVQTSSRPANSPAYYPIIYGQFYNQTTNAWEKNTSRVKPATSKTITSDSTQSYVSWVRVDDEIMGMTAEPTVSGTTVTASVRRGMWGTPVQAHSAGARVYAPNYVGKSAGIATTDLQYAGIPTRQSLYQLRYTLKQWQGNAIGWLARQYTREASNIRADSTNPDSGDPNWGGILVAHCDICSPNMYNIADGWGNDCVPWNDEANTTETTATFAAHQLAKVQGLRSRFTDKQFHLNNYATSDIALSHVQSLVREGDAVTLENWMAKLSTTANKAADFDKPMNLMLWAAANDQGVLAWPRWDYGESTWSSAAQFKRFSYAAYLLAWRPTLRRFCFGAGWGVDGSSNLNLPEDIFRWGLGVPSANYTSVTNIPQPVAGALYRRDYTKGVVLVNPTGTARSFTLPADKTWYRVGNNTSLNGISAASGSISVSAYDAAVFVLDTTDTGEPPPPTGLARRQQAATNANSTQVTVTLPAAPLQGNALIVRAACAPTGRIISITGGGWTKIQNERVAIFRKIAGASESTTVSVSIDGAAAMMHAQFDEYQGINTTTPFATASAGTTFSSATSASTGTTTGTVAKGLALAAWGLGGAAGTATPSFTNGFSDDDESPGDNQRILARKIFTGATATTHESTATWATARNGNALVVVLNEAGSTGGSTIVTSGVIAVTASGSATARNPKIFHQWSEAASNVTFGGTAVITSGALVVRADAIAVVANSIAAKTSGLVAMSVAVNVSVGTSEVDTEIEGLESLALGGVQVLSSLAVHEWSEAQSNTTFEGASAVLSGTLVTSASASVTVVSTQPMVKLSGVVATGAAATATVLSSQRFAIAGTLTTSAVSAITVTSSTRVRLSGTLTTSSVGAVQITGGLILAAPGVLVMQGSAATLITNSFVDQEGSIEVFNLVVTQPTSAQQTDQLTITWSPVPRPNVAYDVERNGSVIRFNYADTTLVDTGLQPGTHYAYRVRAVKRVSYGGTPVNSGALRTTSVTLITINLTKSVVSSGTLAVAASSAAAISSSTRVAGTGTLVTAASATATVSSSTRVVVGGKLITASAGSMLVASSARIIFSGSLIMPAIAVSTVVNAMKTTFSGLLAATGAGVALVLSSAGADEIAFVGSNFAAASSLVLPSFLAGDLAITYAYRNGSTTPPTGVAGWTDIVSSNGADTNSRRIGFRVLQAGDTTTGTWANATSMQVIVLRGQSTSGSPIGAIASGGTNTSTMTLPALTGMNASGTSWVVGFGGSKATNANTKAAAGMTTRSGSIGSLGLHTRQRTTSHSATGYDSTVNASGNRTDSVEVLTTPPGSSVAQVAWAELEIPAGSSSSGDVYKDAY